MSTETKAQRSASKISDRDFVPAPVASPARLGLNDKRADTDPVLGHFVEVIDGEYKGSYGVFIETTADGDAVVRSRDAEAQRLTTPVSSLVAAEPGKR